MEAKQLYVIHSFSSFVFWVYVPKLDLYSVAIKYWKKSPQSYFIWVERVPKTLRRIWEGQDQRQMEAITLPSSENEVYRSEKGLMSSKLDRILGKY